MRSGFEVMARLSKTLNLPNDVEDTAQLALTMRELGLMIGGLHFIYQLFPETRKDVSALTQKMFEVMKHQGVIPFDYGDEDE